MLRRVIPGPASTPLRVSSSTPPTGTAPPLAPQGLYQATPRLETSGVAEIVQLDAADAAEAPCATPFATGSERLADGTELHLASLRFVDTSITFASTDHPAFAALKEEFFDVLGGPPRGLPPDRGIELTLETGGRPMPQTRPLKPFQRESWRNSARSWSICWTAAGYNRRRRAMRLR